MAEHLTLTVNGTIHTVEVDEMRSCMIPVSAVTDAGTTTLDGLGMPEQPHPLQAAWLEEQVSQCAYCINGWTMTAAAFLRDTSDPGDDEIKTALGGLICRCGTHGAAFRAVQRAVQARVERD
jgi:nicotinate dehydrogenase subunit A